MSFHHGGGVGIGYSLHAGMVVVADGTDETRERLGCVLTTDCGMGVVRHADAGYEDAIETADEKASIGVSDRPRPDHRYVRYRCAAIAHRLRRVGHDQRWCDRDRERAGRGRRYGRRKYARPAFGRRARFGTVHGGSGHGRRARPSIFYAAIANRTLPREYPGEPAPLGMAYTVERTREALLEPERFYSEMLGPRLHTILLHGTTTLEVKSGYALHKPGEAALLDLIDRHRADAGVPRPGATVLGAHALPPEFVREGKDAFMDYLIDQLLPVAAGHGAEYADAFCEPGFFSPEQTRRYLQAARENGYTPAGSLR